MVFISKVDRLPPEIDKKKLKQGEKRQGGSESFAETFDSLVGVDAVEVTLSDDQKQKNKNPKKEKGQADQGESKSKLNIEV